LKFELALNLLASTHPAEPPPKIIKSYLFITTPKSTHSLRLR
jgi:hypothetical protein